MNNGLGRMLEEAIVAKGNAPTFAWKNWEQEVLGKLIAYFSWYDTGHIENDGSNNSSLLACVFVTALTFLPSRCVAAIRGFLPSRCLATIRGINSHTHTHTQTATWSHKPTQFFKNRNLAKNHESGYSISRPISPECKTESLPFEPTYPVRHC
jgi:hypothetical protein